MPHREFADSTRVSWDVWDVCRLTFKLTVGRSCPRVV
jgi:hypothetical protein